MNLRWILISASLQAKDLSLTLEIEKGLPACFLDDATRLTQVVQNLIGNSIKFTETGGITISVKTSSNGLCFSITDTGIGILPERQDAIFEGFTQVDGSTSRKYGGTGLGTTISKRIVELMGGWIWLESKIGKGSTFFFEIPLTETECIEIEEIKTTVILKSLNILLVEDQAANQELATIRLKEKGHTLTLAENGLEAVQAWESGSFDLILMDLQMPIMNGFEATQAIRTKETDAQIPIIALTASNITGDEGKCYDAGMNGYVSKPIDFDNLWREIGKLIPGAILKTVELNSDIISDENSLGTLKGISIEEGLKRWGSIEAYRKVLLGFPNQSKNLEKLEVALKEGDTNEAKAIVHALKGVAGNLSITDVARIATALDTVLSKNQLSETEDLFAQLKKAFSVVLSSIQTLKESSIVKDQPAKEIDLEVIKPLLQKLADFILLEDLDQIEVALDLLEEIFPQASAIRNNLDEYDFDAAMETLNKIAKNIGISTE